MRSSKLHPFAATGQYSKAHLLASEEIRDAGAERGDLLLVRCGPRGPQSHAPATGIFRGSHGGIRRLGLDRELVLAELGSEIDGWRRDGGDRV